jgi:enoyl-CoA hydratase/carnithine racemase
MMDITAAGTTNAAGEPLVLVERRGQVGIVTLNRPEVRNAVNRELTVAVADALDELEADDAVWVIVITGAGDKAFCAGQDLNAISSRPASGGSTGARSGGLGRNHQPSVPQAGDRRGERLLLGRRHRDLSRR